MRFNKKPAGYSQVRKETSSSLEEIVKKHYPDLEIEDVKACARYATDIVKHEEVHIGAV